MVNFIPDNKSKLSNEDAIIIIKDFFNAHLKHYLLGNLSNYDNYKGFSIEYLYKNSKIVIGNSWRGFEHDIIIDNKAYSLFNFEKNLKGILTCSKINLETFLRVLQDFLSSHSK